MVDSAPPVALLSASRRTVVGERPTISASAARTTTDSLKLEAMSDMPSPSDSPGW